MSAISMSLPSLVPRAGEGHVGRNPLNSRRKHSHRSFSPIALKSTLQSLKINSPISSSMSRGCETFLTISSYASVRKLRQNNHVKFNELSFIASCLLEEQPNTQIVTVDIKSNHGKVDIVRLAAISILDRKYKPVSIIKATSVPENKSGDILDLFDGKMAKNDENELVTFSFEKDKTISIIIIVDREIDIHGVRIFNSTFDPDSGVKDIEVRINNNFMTKGEVQKLFGADFRFESKFSLASFNAVSSAQLIREMFPEQFVVDHGFVDTYGEYPFIQVKTFLLEIFATRSKTLNVGLNGFEFFDEKGIKLTLDSIENISIKNALRVSNSSVLIKEDMVTTKPDQMFTIEKYDEDIPPTIEITFKEEIKLAKISIWNFNSTIDTPAYGVKKAKVKLNDKTCWIGVVKCATGCTMGASQCVTEIWLTDSHELKESLTFPELIEE
ncbi:hypothetical protein TRFO_35908 [Tritrichomonas foetus]|uniref:KATNIP domain-containing protein n=1 Tax=Tritrichomonas foetus TaxID=1144522 RepID=A0A1J4JF02_9EUKA|nr:hypothetical protein TRFO_35908 [Tritrichomonas foetus]|eukprot:OHS97774.1 hypothetical protein TRFO_35908 [Tritrichomonas foetus]